MGLSIEVQYTGKNAATKSGKRMMKTRCVFACKKSKNWTFACVMVLDLCFNFPPFILKCFPPCVLSDPTSCVCLPVFSFPGVSDCRIVFICCPCLSASPAQLCLVLWLPFCVSSLVFPCAPCLFVVSSCPCSLIVYACPCYLPFLYMFLAACKFVIKVVSCFSCFQLFNKAHLF